MPAFRRHAALRDAVLIHSLLEESERLLRQVAEDVYGADPRYRATVFDRVEVADRIHAFLRWQDGVVARVPAGGVSFARGQVVAGRAWQTPGRFFVLELPDFHDRRDLVRFYVDAVGVDETAASLLGSWMERARSILCVGLHLDPSDEPVVLSVDTQVAGGFAEECDGRPTLRGAQRMLPILAEFREALSLHAVCGQV